MDCVARSGTVHVILWQTRFDYASPVLTILHEAGFT